jgi:hypothetical protein
MKEEPMTMIAMPKEPAIWPRASLMKPTPALPTALALTRLTVSRCDDGSARTRSLVHAWTHA